MSKEETPIELINSMREQIAINETMHDYTCSSEWVRCFLDQLEESVKTDSQAKVLKALEDKYSHDDITHALAYGYKGAKSHLTHSEVLKRYKESNMKQK